jgi:transcription termination/antitermination protein NusG
MNDDDKNINNDNAEMTSEPETPAISTAEETNEENEPADISQPQEAVQPAEATEQTTTDVPADSVDEKSANTNPNAKWYVVHTYSGHENKVAATLKQRIESQHLQDKIFDVLVPVQDKIEIRGGKKTEVKEKIFPGYILVKMELDDNTWLAVRTTQGVTSFVGIGNKPTPIPEAEVQTIVRFTQVQAPTFKQIFVPNDTIKIVDGPFSEFIGKVDSVDEEKGKVRVLVSIFGRETPVELDFLQVQKI